MYTENQAASEGVDENKQGEDRRTPRINFSFRMGGMFAVSRQISST